MILFDAVGLSVRVAAKDGAFKPVPQTHRIAKVEFTDDESKADKLAIDVDNSDLYHLDSPIWREGNIVKLSWGTGGFYAPDRDCKIDKVSGGTVLHVEAKGGEMSINKIFRMRRFENVKRSDIAKTVASEMGFSSQQMFVQDTGEVLEQVTQARQTDAMFLMSLARREGFDWFIDFDGFHFHERQLQQKPQLVLRYRSGDRDGSDIISFNFEKGVAATAPGSIKVVGRDPLTKEDYEFIADNDSVGRHSLAGSILAVGPDDAAKHGEPLAAVNATQLVVPSSESTRASAERFARGLYKRVQLSAVQLDVTARGVPCLLAKSTVKVEGLGPTLSGIYHIKSIAHKIRPSPYTMALKLARDGMTMTVSIGDQPLPGQGQGVSSAGTVNTALAQPVTTLPTKQVSAIVSEFLSSVRSIVL